MNFFKLTYFLRRFKEQKIISGLAVKAQYEDISVKLDVQPTVASDLKNLPEGDRASKSIKSFGDFAVKTANPATAMRADRLYYNGEWYECISSSYFEHTPLRHYESLYTKVSEADNQFTSSPNASAEEESNDG